MSFHLNIFTNSKVLITAFTFCSALAFNESWAMINEGHSDEGDAQRVGGKAKAKKPKLVRAQSSRIPFNANDLPGYDLTRASELNPWLTVSTGEEGTPNDPGFTERAILTSIRSVISETQRPGYCWLYGMKPNVDWRKNYEASSAMRAAFNSLFPEAERQDSPSLKDKAELCKYEAAKAVFAQEWILATQYEVEPLEADFKLQTLDKIDVIGHLTLLGYRKGFKDKKAHTLVPAWRSIDPVNIGSIIHTLPGLIRTDFSQEQVKKLSEEALGSVKPEFVVPYLKTLEALIELDRKPSLSVGEAYDFRIRLMQRLKYVAPGSYSELVEALRDVVDGDFTPQQTMGLMLSALESKTRTSTFSFLQAARNLLNEGVYAFLETADSYNLRMKFIEALSTIPSDQYDDFVEALPRIFRDEFNAEQLKGILQVSQAGIIPENRVRFIQAVGHLFSGGLDAPLTPGESYDFRFQQIGRLKSIQPDLYMGVAQGLRSVVRKDFDGEQVRSLFQSLHFRRFSASLACAARDLFDKPMDNRLNAAEAFSFRKELIQFIKTIPPKDYRTVAKGLNEIFIGDLTADQLNNILMNLQDAVDRHNRASFVTNIGRLVSTDGGYPSVGMERYESVFNIIERFKLISVPLHTPIVDSLQSHLLNEKYMFPHARLRLINKVLEMVEAPNVLPFLNFMNQFVEGWWPEADKRKLIDALSHVLPENYEAVGKELDLVCRRMVLSTDKVDVATVALKETPQEAQLPLLKAVARLFSHEENTVDGIKDGGVLWNGSWYLGERVQLIKAIKLFKPEEYGAVVDVLMDYSKIIHLRDGNIESPFVVSPLVRLCEVDIISPLVRNASEGKALEEFRDFLRSMSEAVERLSIAESQRVARGFAFVRPEEWPEVLLGLDEIFRDDFDNTDKAKVIEAVLVGVKAGKHLDFIKSLRKPRSGETVEDYISRYVNFMKGSVG